MRTYLVGNFRPADNLTVIINEGCIAALAAKSPKKNIGTSACRVKKIGVLILVNTIIKSIPDNLAVIINAFSKLPLTLSFSRSILFPPPVSSKIHACITSSGQDCEYIMSLPTILPASLMEYA